MDGSQQPVENERVTDQTVVVGNFQLGMKMPNEQSIMVTGMIYLGDKLGELNDRMDLFRAAALRQQEIAEIPVLESKLDGLQQALKHQQEALKSFGDQQKKGRKLTSQEKANLETNIPASIKMLSENIAQGMERIATLKRKHNLVN